MKRMKRTIVLLAVLLMLVSGAITAYAVSAETGREADRAGESSRAVQAAPSDYAAEEMAVETYYQDLERSEDTEMV